MTGAVRKASYPYNSNKSYQHCYNSYMNSLTQYTHLLYVHNRDAEMEAPRNSNTSADSMEINEDTNSDKETGLILFSRSAQRKARRAMQTSDSEEIFRLAVDHSLRASGSTIVSLLVLMIKSSHHLLMRATGDTGAAVELKDRSVIVYPSQSDSSAVLGVDLSKSLAYMATLTERNDVSDNAKVNTEGDAAAFALLLLEFVFEVLENRSFHRVVSSMLTTGMPEGPNGGVQAMFLELSDQILQLLSCASHLGMTLSNPGKILNGQKQDDGLVSVRLGSQVLNVARKGIAKRVWAWCLSFLESTQRLLDPPTFVAILQELLDHEEMSVRQKALQILGERLEKMNIGDKPDLPLRILFLDLLQHFRSAVRNATELFISSPAQSASTSSSSSSSSKTPAKRNRISSKTVDDLAAEENLPSLDGSVSLCNSPTTFARLGLAQSSLICIEILARHLGRSTGSGSGRESKYISKNGSKASSNKDNSSEVSSTGLESEWQTTLEETLAETIKLAQLIDKFHFSSASAEAEITHESTKLLGTTFICAGTLCGAVGPRALPQLSSLMLSALQCLEKNGILFKSNSWSRDETGATVRGRILLLRSLISTVAAIVTELPAFSHPYLTKIIESFLALADDDSSSEGVEANDTLGSLGDRAVLHQEIDRCLIAIIRNIPSRLSVPLLLQASSQTLAHGPRAASRYCGVLSHVWASFDRQALVQHKGDLCAAATLLLDYRRAFGDQSLSTEKVDAAAVGACVELCLKFTEVELRSFLASLSEWKDIKIPAATNQSPEREVPEWKSHSRGVTFYRLVAALGSRLRSIFVPTMGMLWEQAAGAVSSLVAVISTLDGVSEGVSTSKTGSKKRKQIDVASSSSGGTVTEQILRAQYVLESIRVCCTHDSDGFLDDTRYNGIMPQVCALLSARLAFSSGVSGDESFLSFIDSFVSPCLSSLAVAIGQDLQWKPLNRKVLMTMRDNRRTVKLAAIKTLNKLFTEVGEEYLLLLPECLPFLSELLEDDNDEIVTVAGDLVRYIEDLSGEKLDSYLL